MKRIPFLALILSVAAFLSLIGTGFAIWYNVTVPSVVIEGDTDNPQKINAYAVDRSSDYIALKKKDDGKTPDITVFNYSALSFTNAQGEASDTAEIKVNYKLDVEKCRGKDTDGDGKVLLTLTLTHENTLGNAPLFAAANGTGEKKSVTATVNSANETEPTAASTDGKLVFECTVDLSGRTGVIDVEAVYTFNIPKNYDSNGDEDHTDAEDKAGNFRNVFGKYLMAGWDDPTTTETVETITTTFITEAYISED